MSPPTISPGPTLCLVQFSQQEEKRQKSERLQQQQKHENQMRDMVAQCESNMSELQQLQVWASFTASVSPGMSGHRARESLSYKPRVN